MTHAHFYSVKHSILGRLLLATLVLLPLFCGLLGWSLDKAFTSSTHANEKAKLTLQVYSLIASAELEQDSLWLPEHFTDDRLNQASSDLFAVVFSKDPYTLIWRSKSAIKLKVPASWKATEIQPGSAVFGEVGNSQDELFFLQYHVVWEGDGEVERSFQFVVFERQDRVNQQIKAYRQTLWGWLITIAISITLVQVLILKWGLKPIKAVSDDLSLIQQGKQNKLHGSYPLELEEMTNSINTLLSNEAEQRKRYKKTLSNLAHSLKTPLAIMQGSLKPNNSAQNAELAEQINRIDQIVSYQLKKAISVPLNPFSNTIPLKTNCQKVVAALHKVYRDKPTNVVMDIPEDLTFKGEKGDLMEILGNLIDNAFKYGKGKIHIEASPINKNGLSLVIEDNGNGIATEYREKLLQRGERADTTQIGQGIGLSVVADIVSSYQGSIEINQSDLGGALVTVSL